MGKKECGERNIRRKIRRNKRRTRKEARNLRSAGRPRFRAAEVIVGAFNIRALAFNGNNGIGHSKVILEVCRELDGDVVGLRDARSDGHTPLTVAVYTVFFAGADESEFERKTSKEWDWLSWSL